MVHYVPSYKYLGIKLYTDRERTIHDYTMKLISDMNISHSRFFGYNSILATLSPTAVVQLLKSACINNYLLSIIPSSTESIIALGTPLRNIMRTALHGLPKGTPTSFLNVESNIPSATFLLTRAHLTHFLSTTTTSHATAPAAALMRAQLTRALLPGGAASLPRNSWLATTSSHMATPAAALGPWTSIPSILNLPQNHTVTPNDVTLAACVYARQVVTLNLMRDAARDKVTSTVTHLSHTPALSAGPKQHYHDLLLGYHHALTGLATPAKATPISTIAPGGSGVLIPQLTRATDSRLLLALRSHRLGPCALHYCYGPQKWRVKQGPKTDEMFRTAARGTPCPFCPGSTACAYHTLTECTHPPVVAARLTLSIAATAYLPTLSTHIVNAYSGDDSTHIPLPIQVAHHILQRSPVSPPDWSSPTGKNFLFRLVLVLPWPEAAVDDPTATHCRALGYLMDSTIVRNSRRHRLANSWVLWGAKALKRMLTVWADAVDALP
jgi:hypothetical protein